MTEWQVENGGKCAFCLKVQSMKNPNESQKITRFQTHPLCWFSLELFTSFLWILFFFCLLSLRINQNTLVDSKNEIEIPKITANPFQVFGNIYLNPRPVRTNANFKKIKTEEGWRSKQRIWWGDGQGKRNSNLNSKETFSCFLFFVFFFH